MYEINAKEFGLGVLGQIFGHDFLAIWLELILMSKKMMYLLGYQNQNLREWFILPFVVTPAGV